MKNASFAWLALATLVSIGIIAFVLDRRPGDWIRNKPLAAPLAVSSVSNGSIALANGSVLRPAGIVRSPSVSEEQYDAALRTMTAQGVEVRDLVSGEAAMLQAEPKFYNWCGTSSRRWPGSYFQCGVSEAMVYLGYADLDMTTATLKPLDQWRIEGARHIRDIEQPRTDINDRISAFSYSGGAKILEDFDSWIEVLYQPPPLPR
jgi:hypothetical protein